MPAVPPASVPAAPPRSWAADNPAHLYQRHPLREATRLYLLVYMALVMLFICLLVTRDSVFNMWSIRRVPALCCFGSLAAGAYHLLHARD